MRFAFGEHVLDAERRELRRRGEPVALEPQVFDLLLFLVENRDRVVSKDDLVKHVWHGRAVSDSALATRFNAARKAVGDSGAAQQVIRTLSRKGVRFVAEVTERGESSVSAVVSIPPVCGKPSIAVLPFANMTGDPRQDHFADGIVEEIIVALSRFRWLSVAARSSSFAYRGKHRDVREVGRELGVGYVLEGSVRKAGRQVRITAQLADTATGMQLWADRFEGGLEDMFGLQDRVAAHVAGAIEPALQAAESARSVARTTSDLTAYDLYLRAHALYLGAARQVPDALGLLEQAIARDPGHAPALAWAAICCFRLISDGRSADPSAHRRKGIDFARRALERGSEDPAVLANAAQALTFFGEDSRAMMALVDRALTLNPNFARGWFSSSAIHLFAGQPERAIEHVKTALWLTPRARIAPSLGLIGMAHFLSEHFDEAIPALLLAIEEDPSYPQPYRYLAACYAHLGRLGEAQAVIARLRAVGASVIPDPSYLRQPQHHELYISGVLRALRV